MIHLQYKGGEQAGIRIRVELTRIWLGIYLEGFKKNVDTLAFRLHEM